MGTIDFPYLEQHFPITIEKRQTAILSMKASELVEPEKMARLLQAYAPLIESNEPGAAAAFFASWFSRAALVLQYSISVWNCSMNLSLDQLTVHLCQEVNGGVFWFEVDGKPGTEGPPSGSARTVWREEQYRKFYSQTVAPLYQSLSLAAGTDLRLIWGQMPTAFYYYVDLFQEQAKSPAEKAQIAEDFHYLSREADPSVFGRPKNPFDVNVRWIEDARDPNRQVRMKHVCCLYYQTGANEYCYTCPRMKEKDREERRMRLRQPAAFPSE